MFFLLCFCDFSLPFAFRFSLFAFGCLSFIRRGISFSVGPHSVFLLCSCGFFFAFAFRFLPFASGLHSVIRRDISFSVGPHNVFPPLLSVNGVFLTRSAYLYEGKGRRYTIFFARAKISSASLHSVRAPYVRDARQTRLSSRALLMRVHFLCLTSFASWRP